MEKVPLLKILNILEKKILNIFKFFPAIRYIHVKGQDQYIHMYILHRDKISEDESPGLIIIHAEAIDDDDTYENQKIDYSIISGNEESKFQIVSKTGNIVLIGSLNREKTPSYRLEIMVSFILKLNEL